MKNKLLGTLVLCAALFGLMMSPAQADLEKFKWVTLQNTASTGQGTPIGVDTFSTVLVDVTVSATGTVVFEVAADPDTPVYKLKTCVSIQDTASSLVTQTILTDTFQCNVAGAALFQARISANTGTIVVKARGTTAYAKVGGSGGAVDLQGSFSIGKSITGANSRANAFRVGDGVLPVCLYTDATLGPQVRNCTDANSLAMIASTFTYKFWDEAGALSMEDIKPSGASPSLMWTYPNAAYRPKKQVFFPAGSLFGDGTNCPASASTVTINSGAPRATFICTNNASSSLYGEVLMPDSWDGSTVTFMWEGIQTAADTNIMNSHIATACRATTVAINNTWGTSQTLNIAAVSGSNKLNTVTSAALTADGTCTGAGTLLQFRWQLDTSTTSAVATLHNLGFKMTYSEKSRSS